ncbi:MAG: tetratricopeptide repeat protein [Opitutaceae bacterium]|jgi:tetratricopeptide (TPR) repeat protein
MNWKPFLLAAAVLAGAALDNTGCTRQTAARHVARGDAAAQAGDFTEAEAEYRLALELLLDDPAVLVKLGKLYYDQGRILPAYLLFRRAVQAEPENADAQLEYGLASLSLAKIPDARSAAQSVLKTRPADETALLLLADSCVTDGDIGQAEQKVQALREGNPDAAGYHLALGALKWLRRDLDGAEAELRTALRLDPKSAAVYGELGNILAQQHRTADAREALKTASELSPPRSPLRLAFVNFLIANGEAAEAKKVLNEITQKAADYIPAWTAAMQLADREHRSDEALSDAGRILEVDSINYDALSESANLKLAGRDTDGAIADLKRLAGFYARAPQIRYRLAEVYLKKDDLSDAEDNLHQAILFAPNYDDAIMLLAELELRKANPAEAVASLSQLLKRRPTFAPAAFLLAQAYREEGHVDQSLPIFRRLAEAFPKVPTGSYLAGMACFELKRLPEARQLFEQSARIQEDYWPALEMLVQLDLIEGRQKEAGDRVGALVQKYPKQADAWLLRARVRLASRDAAGAESDLRQAIDLDPTSQFAYLQLVRIYLRNRDAGKAMTELNALEGRVSSPGSLMEVGMVHDAQGDYEAARRAYEKVLALEPNFTPALNNLAVLYNEHLRQGDKAYELARQARDLAPGDPVVADTLGWILFKKGEYGEALPLLEESAQARPAEAEYQYHVGMAYNMLGQETPARIALQAAVAGGADASWAAAARERLAALEVDPAKALPEVQADIERQARQEPNNPVLRGRLAAIELQAGRAGQAAADYEAALKSAPNSLPTLVALVQLYSGPVPDLRRARELARQAHELAPDDGEISETLGRILRRTGDFKWSLDLLEEARLALHDPSDLAYDLALAHACVGQISAAKSELGEALGANSTAPQREAAGVLASILSAIEHPTEAPAAWPAARKLLDADPENIPASMVGALAQEMQGDYPGAGAACEKILRTDPDFAPAARELAILYAERLGNDSRAEQLALQAQPAFPDDSQLAYELGVIHYRRADFSAAVKLLQQSLRGRDPDAKTVYYLGMSHYRLKDPGDAKDELRHAVELNLAGAEASQAEKTLDELGRGGAADARQKSN